MIGVLVLVLRAGASRGVNDISMLAWLVVLPYFIPAFFLASMDPPPALVAPPGAPSHIEAVLPLDMQFKVFSEFGFAGLLQASKVSPHFAKLTGQILVRAYCLLYNGKIYLNYTTLLYEFDRLVQAAEQAISEGDSDEASKWLYQIRIIQSVIEAKFGYSMKQPQGDLPEFFLHGLDWDLINDPSKITVLPYVIDVNINGNAVVYLVRGLYDLKRFDLLDQLTFSAIRKDGFDMLLSFALPDYLIERAAMALQRNEPDSKLSDLLAFAGFGAQEKPLLTHTYVPLFTLRYFSEREISFPTEWRFIDGLKESSIGFWTHVSKGGPGVEKILDLVRAHGDTGAKHLANAFCGPVGAIELYEDEQDVYQAMLTHCHFNSDYNGHVTRNYKSMLEGLTQIGYHTACAFLTFGNYNILFKYPHEQMFGGYRSEYFIHRVYRIQSSLLSPLLLKYLRRSSIAPELLELMLREEAKESCVLPVWRLAQIPGQWHGASSLGCVAPLAVLKRLALGPEISIEDAQGMLGMLTKLVCQKKMIPKEAHVLYVLMFWGAPEHVVEHFFDLVPSGFQLEHRFVQRYLLKKMCSKELAVKLLQRTASIPGYALTELQLYWPDLGGMAGFPGASVANN